MAWVAIAAWLLIGCGGGDDDDGGASADGSGGFSRDTTCGVALALGGALDLTVAPSRSAAACATQTSFDTGIDAGFVFAEGALDHVELVIDDVHEGETGASFPAHVTIVHDDGREWSAQDCSAAISQHEHVGPGELGWERYRVVGSVACEAPLPEEDGAKPALELESLRFVATISWG